MRKYFVLEEQIDVYENGTLNCGRDPSQNDSPSAHICMDASCP